MKAKDPRLFEAPPLWEEYWHGMPEYGCEELKPIKSIQVNFASEEDMQAFAKLLGQNLTMKTKSIWHPKQDPLPIADRLRFADES